jgi:hypothetical protein
MAIIFAQGWIEDDEGYIRHDGYRIYTTRERAIEDTKRLERDLNSPSCVSSVWASGAPFEHVVPDAVFKRAQEHEGFSVENLTDLAPKN